MPVRDKVVSAAEAVAIIRPGDMVATSGFVGVGTPDAIFVALEQRFLATGQPRELGLLFAAAPGDGKEKGLNRLAHDGLIRRAVGGHWSLVPKLGKMAADGLIEAWNLPLGCVSQLFREIAGRRPGLLSRVGIGTFVDPRQGGGKLNAITTRDLVRVMEIDDREWLFYEAIPVDVAIIRGTTADPDGNISMEREALILDNLAIAMAAKASKGFVIAQVERLAAADALPAKQVVVPGILVDCVVVAPPELHQQTFATSFSAAFSGQLKVPLDRIPPMALDERKIIARRCAMELPMGGVVNLGIGMPEAVAAVAKEENLLDQVTLTAEPGIIGGLPQGGLDFGAAINPIGDHRPEPAVRLLRRRRARPRLPRHGAGRRGRQRQCQPVRRPVRRCRRLHQHHPERPGRWSSPAPSPPAGCGSRRPTAGCASRRKAAAASSWPRSSRSPSMAASPPRPGSGCSTSPSAACSS